MSAIPVGGVPVPKKEGALKDAEVLAVLLAASNDVGDPLPVTRVDLFEIWNSKRPETQRAYMLRAKRLLKAWGV